MSTPQRRYYGKQNGEHNKDDKMKRLKKAISEKSMKVLNFLQSEEDELKYQILGSTGTIYDVIFNNQKMSCTCPDHERHKSYCKHIYLVYIKVFHLVPDLEATSNTVNDMQFLMMKNAHEKFMEQRKSSAKALEEDKQKSKYAGYRYCEEDECSICFDIFGQQKIFGCKTCKNVFHDHCMTAIFKYNSKCPMCRSSISKEEEKEEEEDEEVKNITNRIKNTIFEENK